MSTNGHDCVLLAHQKQQRRVFWSEVLGVLAVCGMTLGGGALMFLWLLDLL